MERFINPTNRYANAPRNDDYTIDQNWESYSAEEHNRWDRLIMRMETILPNRACNEFLSAMKDLALSSGGIPNMAELSDLLAPVTGWKIVPVAELVPDDVFFDHLANKRFPAGAFIRPEEQFEYLKEPDIFHDIFWHVPLLANPIFSQFMQAYGQGGLKAQHKGRLKNLARLYWYTVEFGLLNTDDGLRIFGAGILSSPNESIFSLESDSPHRIEFGLKRVLRTDYIIDDLQQTYFVIESLEDLLEQCYSDFSPLYKDVANESVIRPDQVLKNDRIRNFGTLSHVKNKTSTAPDFATTN